MNNDYFTLCKDASKDSLTTYVCCKNTCLQGTDKLDPKFREIKRDLCTNTCNKLFDEHMNYKTQCAYEYDCWNGDWYSSCLDLKKKEIHTCCMNKCKSDINNYSVDCHKYCKNYDIN